MRTAGVLLLIARIAASQAPTPSLALMRGVLLERDPQTSAGEFSVRAADNQVFRYRFDSQTYVERNNRLTDVNGLQPGDKVEVLSDVARGSALRYARTVHVLEEPPPARTLSAARLRTSRTLPERSLTLGNLTYSGVVFRVNSDRLVLHTRAGGDQSILLRKDTLYVANGEMVDPADLKPNMRVFVRAGKDLYDEVEAYQIMWGSILDPSAPQP
jgi:hypothetical protein